MNFLRYRKLTLLSKLLLAFVHDRDKMKPTTMYDCDAFKKHQKSF